MRWKSKGSFPAANWVPYLKDILDLEGRAAASELIVAEQDGQIVGCVSYFPPGGKASYPTDSFSEHWPSDWSAFRLLAVDPEVRDCRRPSIRVYRLRDDPQHLGQVRLLHVHVLAELDADAVHLAQLHARGRIRVGQEIVNAGGKAAANYDSVADYLKAGLMIRQCVETLQQELAPLVAEGAIEPAGWRSRDGRLWFPTAKGLAVIDPMKVKPPRQPLAVIDDDKPEALRASSLDLGLHAEASVVATRLPARLASVTVESFFTSRRPVAL